MAHDLFDRYTCQMISAKLYARQIFLSIRVLSKPLLLFFSLQGSFNDCHCERDSLVFHRQRRHVRAQPGECPAGAWPRPLQIRPRHI